MGYRRCGVHRESYQAGNYTKIFVCAYMYLYVCMYTYIYMNIYMCMYEYIWAIGVVVYTGRDTKLVIM
jgi:hypothetical protein